MAGTRSLPSPSVLRRLHNIYIDDLWKSDGWGCTQWRGYSAQMLFWYGVAGAPYAGGSDFTDRYLASIVGKRKISGVPLAKLKLWKSANRLVNDIRRETGMELVPWLAQTSGGRTARGNDFNRFISLGPRLRLGFYEISVSSWTIASMGGRHGFPMDNSVVPNGLLVSAST